MFRVRFSEGQKMTPDTETGSCNNRFATTSLLRLLDVVPLTLAPKGKKVRVIDCIFSFGNSRVERAEHSIQVLARKTDGN